MKSRTDHASPLPLEPHPTPEAVFEEAADRLAPSLVGNLKRALADPAVRVLVSRIDAEPLASRLRQVSVKLAAPLDVPMHVRFGRRVWL